MSALKKYFDKSVNQSSPVQKDLKRVVSYDENGNEYVTYEEVDYSALQASHGTSDMWSLNSLLKAGINPNFPIHTGNSTRLDGLDSLKQFESMADEIIASESNEEK